MWSFKTAPALLCGALITLAGCSVEPLNAARSDSALVAGTEAASTAQVLRTITVNNVTSRPAQQVRNALLFALNGGNPVEGGDYSISLVVAKQVRTLSVEITAKAATSAQVELVVSYTLLKNGSSAAVTNGTRRSIASFDRTPQNFANQRAERDAVNRAAKDVAQQIRLALGQALAAQ